MIRHAMVSHEFFDILKPVLYLGRVFCLQPLEWVKTDFSYVLSKSHFFIVYSHVTVIFFVVASIYGLSQIYQVDVVNSIRIAKHTERYVTFSDVGVVLIPSLIGVFETSFKLDKYIQYYDYLKKCDFLLRLQVSKSPKSMLVSSITIFFTFSILVFDMVMWIRLSSKSQKILLLFLYFFPYYVCYCFTMVIELIFWQSIHNIKTRMIFLNTKIRKLLGEDFVDFFIKVEQKKSKNQQTKRKTTLEEIQALISSYQKLTEAANSVNDYFGLLILIIILGCLIHLLVTPYALYSLIFITGNTMFIVSQSIWMLGHVLRLLLIVEPCHGCLDESKTTSELVCKLLCLEIDQETKKALEFFLTYLTQCKIEFTAFGLTKINRTLLTTIAGAVTTYLVILFQFK